MLTGNNKNLTVTRKRPTRDDLLRAAQNAAESAEVLMAAAAEDTPQRPAYNARGTRDWDKPPVAERVTGEGAMQTGHGLGRRGAQRQEGPTAYERFMDSLRGALERGGNRLRVSENAGYMKIESLHNGHKIYIAKSKTLVTRVESTIPPEQLHGAAEPDRPNGRIASWIPAEPELVAEAIGILVESDDHIRPPERGAGDTSIDRRRNTRQ